MLMNAVLYEYGPRLCLYQYDNKKWAKSHLNVFLRKPSKFRTKVENFCTHNLKNELVSYMVHLRVDRVDLSEPQAFKNVSLQMIIDQTFIFRRIYFK